MSSGAAADPEEESARNPPSPAAVARRALILAAVTCRGHIENGPTDPGARSLYPRIHAWLESSGLTEFLEPEERAIIMAPLGELERRQQLEATWQVEGAAVLGWALGKHPLPPHDAKVDPFKVAEALGFLWEDAAQVVRYAKLRSPKELHAYRELIYAVHCRLREVDRRPQRDDFDRWLQPAWLRALGLTRASPVVEGDLGIEGQPLHRVDPDLLRSISEITYERHRAAIWIAGEGEHYWRLTVDT